MTQKDLEERIETQELVTCILIVAFCVTAFFFWGYLIVTGGFKQSQYTPASPCELGLMEWEEETWLYCCDYWDCPSKHKIICLSENCKIEIEEYAIHNCYGFEVRIEKSCPYFGPDIMVVKEQL